MMVNGFVDGWASVWLYDGWRLRARSINEGAAHTTSRANKHRVASGANKCRKAEPCRNPVPCDSNESTETRGAMRKSKDERHDSGGARQGARRANHPDD